MRRTDMAFDFLGDLTNLGVLGLFAPAIRRARSGRQRHASSTRHGQEVEVTLRRHELRDYWLILEFSDHSPGVRHAQRQPMILVPMSYAFGNPAVPGLLQHRIAFLEQGRTGAARQAAGSRISAPKT